MTPGGRQLGPRRPHPGRVPPLALPVLIALSLTAAPAPAVGQSGSSPSTAASAGQDRYAEGRTAGFRAARLAGDAIPPRLIAATVGGFVAGAGGVMALGYDDGPGAGLSVGLGVVLAVGAGTLGSIMPPPGAARGGALSPRSPEYRRGFEEGYAESTRDRRRYMATVGAVTGAGIGALLLALLLQGQN
jgi:hypothetical protein